MSSFWVFLQGEKKAMKQVHFCILLPFLVYFVPFCRYIFPTVITSFLPEEIYSVIPLVWNGTVGENLFVFVYL